MSKASLYKVLVGEFGIDAVNDSVVHYNKVVREIKAQHACRLKNGRKLIIYFSATPCSYDSPLRIRSDFRAKIESKMFRNDRPPRHKFAEVIKYRSELPQGMQEVIDLWEWRDKKDREILMDWCDYIDFLGVCAFPEAHRKRRLTECATLLKRLADTKESAEIKQ